MDAPNSKNDFTKTYQAFGLRFLCYLLYFVYSPALPLRILGADHYSMVPVYAAGLAICCLDIWVALSASTRKAWIRSGLAWGASVVLSAGLFFLFNTSYADAEPLSFGHNQVLSAALWALVLLPVWAMALWRALRPDGLTRPFL